MAWPETPVTPDLTALRVGFKPRSVPAAAAGTWPEFDALAPSVSALDRFFEPLLATENVVVREFFGKGGAGGDSLRTAIGACDRTEDITLAAVVKVPEKSPFENFDFTLLNIARSGGSSHGFDLTVAYDGRLECSYLEPAEPEPVSRTLRTSTDFFSFTSSWKLVVLLKESGTNKALFGWYDFDGDEWHWEESEGEGGNATSVEEGKVHIGESNNFRHLLGQFAAGYVGPVMSQAEAESLAEAEKLIDWKDGASALWFFDQVDPDSEGLVDLTGNGADEVSTEGGTEALEAPPPIPYYYAREQIAPSVITDSPEGITDAAATLKGRINPNFQATDYWCEYHKELPSGLAVHYDARTLTGLSDGDKIASCPDLSGNGRDAAQEEEAKQPLYKTGILNDKPVMRFDGEDDFLQATGFTLEQPNTIFVVGTQSSSGFENFVDGTSVTKRHSVYRGGTNEWGMIAGTGLLGGTADKDPHVHGAVFNGASSDRRVDGVSVASGDAGATAAEGINLGARYDGTAGFLSGDLAEVLVFDRLLSAAEIEQVEAYLKSKWLAEGDAYKYAPASKEGDAGEGGVEVGVSELVIGLAPDSEYHVRLYAENKYGEAWGDEVSFETLEAGGFVYVKTPSGIVSAKRWVKLPDGELASA